MPINGLSTTKYYERLGVNPFAITENYPRSDGTVLLSENTSYKITHPSGQYDARMGTSLALSGDGTKLIVGMPDGAWYDDSVFENEAPYWPGRVQAYYKNPVSPTTWTPLGPVQFYGLGGEEPTGDENIGAIVAMSRDGQWIASSNQERIEMHGPDNKQLAIFTDNIPGPFAFNANGSRIVVGMPLGGPSTHHGRVTVYGIRESAANTEYINNYILGNSLTGTGNNDNFGAEVCINDEGNIIGVGIPGADLAGSNLGAVKIYKLIGSTWTQIGQSIGLNTEEKVTSLAMNGAGDIICIGSAFNQPPNTNEPTGEISVYKFDGSYWNLLGHKIMNYLTPTVQIGHAVDMSHDGYTIVVANGASTITSNLLNETVVVYRYNGSVWKSVGSFEGPSNTAQNGYSVAISSDGKTIVAGAPGTNSNRGEVRYFTLNV